MENKQCSNCGEIKSLSEFPKNNGNCYRKVCKLCWNSRPISQSTIDRKKERQKEYRNTQEYKDKRKAYRQSLTGKASRQAERHTRREHYTNGDFTPEDWIKLVKAFPNCLACGTSERLTLDHVIPLSKGGSHSLSNSQILCHSCNASKKDKTIDYRPFVLA